MADQEAGSQEDDDEVKQNESEDENAENEEEEDSLATANKEIDGLDFTEMWCKSWKTPYNLEALYEFAEERGVTAMDVQETLRLGMLGDKADEFAGLSKERTLQLLREWWKGTMENLSDKTERKMRKMLAKISGGTEEFLPFAEGLFTFFALGKNASKLESRLTKLFQQRSKRAALVTKLLEEIEGDGFKLSPEVVHVVMKAVQKEVPEDGRFAAVSHGMNNHVPVMIAFLCFANKQSVKALLKDIGNPTLQ